jgi:hypothetical protein
MDGLEELLTPYVEQVIGGRTYRLHQLRLNDWAEAALIIKGNRPSPLASIQPHLKDLDEESRDRLLALAWREERDGDLISQFDTERWLETPVGSIYRFWFMIRQALVGTN